MGISSSGIGSGLDVESLISQLMAAESAPLSKYDNKTAILQSQTSALGQVSSAVGSFQAALTTLNSSSTFQKMTASSGSQDILSGSATTEAVPGKYNVNVTQLAQAQSLTTPGMASTTATLGSGTPTTLTFQFGTVSGGTFGAAGAALGSAAAAGGIANGSLSINGTMISTGSTTTSARALAEAINAQSEETGVTAKADSTVTDAGLFAGFGDVSVDPGASYTLSVGGVTLASLGGAATTLSAAGLDTALADSSTRNALAAANITVSGSAAEGTLQFTAADGSSIDITETVSGTVRGGIGNAAADPNTGSTATATAGVILSSKDGNQIDIGGSNPAAAGFSAGNAGSHMDSGFSLNGAQPSTTITLDAASQSLQGIRDAINKADMGVTATIVSDGSDTPYHLVLTSNKTGEASTMKITVGGENGDPGDPAVAALLGYDPAGVQNLTQTSGAQSTLLNVNGIQVKSESTTVKDAIQGVTINASAVGKTTLTVAEDTSGIKSAVDGFVKAYNSLNSTINNLTAYDPDTQTAGILQGDATVRSIQTQLRRMISSPIEGSGSSLNSLSQLGISFQKDGSLAVDSAKLDKAIQDNSASIGSLFAAMGTTTDSLVKFDKSSAATKPGTYGINVTSLATQGTLTSSAALSGATTIAANTTWRITLNQTDPATESKTQDIKIPAGTYNDKELSALLRSAINGNSTFAGAGDTVEATVDDSGRLSISSSKYGAMSNIAIASVSGTTVDSIFGAATPSKGTDVAGTIGGVAATGNGQALIAAAGSPAEGIQVSITGGNIGERGTVTFSQGYAYQLTNLTASFIGNDSLLDNKVDGLNVSIESVADQRERFTTRLAATEARYRQQFTSLDVMMMSMQQTSAFLTQQLAMLSANTNAD